MGDISKTETKSQRDVYYYRQRLKNRVFSALTTFFASEAARSGVTKRDIALRLRRDPAQITRWLTEPSNLTLETISDLLLAMDAEADPPPIVRFADRLSRNFAHPLIARVLGQLAPVPPVASVLPPPPPGFRGAPSPLTNSQSKIVEIA